MSRNGSGIYSLAAGNPVVTGATISSTWANASLSDIATALTQSIASDGQTTVTNNLPMGNYAHTGVADATVRTMYATAGQVQDSSFTYLTSPAGTNTMTATASIGMSAYATGQRFFFVAPATNTGACTLNINSIGIKSITKSGTTALVAGDIASGAIVQVVYDGTQFQLLNPISTPVSTFSAGTTGLTPSTATNGAVTLAGTLIVANGGTGATTLTTNNVILGNGTSAVQVVAPGTSGNALVSDGTTWASSVVPNTAKAWVNFNGTTGAIVTNFNVSSITVNGTGDYTINFTNALADANYIMASMSWWDTTNNANSPNITGIRSTSGVATTKTSSAIRILVETISGTPINSPQIGVMFFR